MCRHGAGAFVAGLDAGHAYNEFPLMGGQLVPAEYWALPGWRNFFENTAAVQFDHRLLATTTLVSVALTWLAYRAAPLPTSSKRLLHALMAVTATQVGFNALCPALQVIELFRDERYLLSLLLFHAARLSMRSVGTPADQQPATELSLWFTPQHEGWRARASD